MAKLPWTNGSSTKNGSSLWIKTIAGLLLFLFFFSSIFVLNLRLALTRQIDSHELAAALNTGADKFNQGTVNAMVKIFDVDKNGQINLEGFRILHFTFTMSG